MSRIADMLETLPPHMQRLPRDTRGFPVPWFVDRRAPYIDGNPDFRVMDLNHLKTAIRERRCWVCGARHLTREATFVAGPMCGINRTSAEPPCHIECARWSARACPFLAHPKRVRDERNLPKNRQQAGIGITRNPGVAMLWTGFGYQTFRAGGILFELPEPTAVEWWCEGRPATREEVAHSVITGLPTLESSAQMEGAEALADLVARVRDFTRFLPAQLAMGT